MTNYKWDYELPEIFDLNGDLYFIEIPYLPSFITFDAQENQFLYSYDNQSIPLDYNYTIEIILEDNKTANNTYEFNLEVKNCCVNNTNSTNSTEEI